jgi:hypothetical protein
MKDVTSADALDMYLETRHGNAPNRQSAVDRLSHFVEWFNEETEVEHLHELDGIDLKQWRTWRFDPHEHADAYIKAVQD